MDNTKFKVGNMRIAGLLLLKDFIPLYMIDDKYSDYPNKVFFFPNTEEIRIAYAEAKRELETIEFQECENM